MLNAFLSGALMMGFAIAGLVFLRSWRDTRDSLFLCFSLAFLLMAVERVPLALFDKMKEPHSLVYLLRLTGYLCIIVGIVQKNRNAPPGGTLLPFKRRSSLGK